MVPVAFGVPIFDAKPSRLLLNANEVGPVPDDCEVYTRLVKSISQLTFAVSVNSK